ncbi:Bug family tripartite tricarboxylate transporter substrate binding protein [Paracraurococcus ruber]|uniref:LacI family transcriptional regulator n=1 Tax=Paracraurococcus ruber TaxID=77675 RepID=A0ABS1D0E9_9PROT|nr:tripartite tricarboxylate transporter substrate binding protein [Paracraurococcus ruber]MBK1660175.1 LacI family transcriptional regulator [Paracraurococcus ruber]TDG28867.1 tripartite tricarboxylate transporter substrate binding protein [Paracraurococcus ruber]
MLLPWAAQAQAPRWPDRPLKLIVPFPPGGPVDATARILAQAMGPALGQQMVVENRSGAGGVLGIDALAKSAPDGLTLALGSAGAVAVNVSLVPNLPYDPRRDLAPVGMVTAVPSLLVVRPGLAARSLAELLAMARRQPGRVTFASTGPGGTPHLAAELLRLQAGLDLVHVAYRGAAPAITALLGEEVDMAFLDLPVLLPQVREGKLRPLGLAAAARSPALPEVPTMAEAGVAGVEVENWYALLAPARVPAERMATLAAALRAALAQPETAERYLASGARILGGAPEEAARFIAAETARWAEVVRRADIKVD